MPAPLKQVESSTRLPLSADVVVIGGGIVGTFTAYYLAQRGVSVALLEKGRIGGEQSSRNWGWCRQQNRDERELPLSIAAMRIWDTLRQETGEDLGFRRAGLVYGTNDPADLERWETWERMARGYGVESHVLTSAETARLLPGNARTWLGGVLILALKR